MATTTGTAGKAIVPGAAASGSGTSHPDQQPLVWVVLIGGLGNQLFEWAAAVALAHDWSAGEPVIDPRCYRTSPWRQALLAVRGAARSVLGGRDGLFRHRMLDRRLELAALGVEIGALPTTRPTVKQLKELWRDTACRELLGRRVVREAADIDRTSPEQVLIAGWLQSESLFAHRATAIRAALAMEPATAMFRRWRDELAAPGAVVVHVRRGDLVQPKYRKFAVQSPAYYEEAARLVAERTGADRFFVFTDDPAWVRAQVRLPGTTTLVSGDPDATAIDEFSLMRLARHFVMANSTFSWWAAWLGERPDSCVVAPAHWLAAGGRFPDLVPDRWTTLDVPPLANVA